uniref:Uncharacterized protein LOC111118751 n=1 Tax=Crassostrea virginica TaxID=6565 RepID=A0A8B8CFV1_CRAVI|nr:uncharacterized protein LOC111118751 [Crassostrea virginica]
MMWTIFALLLCGIAEAFQKPTVETIDSDKKDTVFIATPSTQVLSHLRDILNQESLVRLSMVQKMQSMAMDLVDVKNKVETLTDNLKKVTEELRTTKAENQKQQREIADLEKARENLSEEFRKLNKTQTDESNEVETLTKNLKMITDELHTNQKEITDLKNLSQEFRQIKTTQTDEINALKNITSEIQSEKGIRCESGILVPFKLFRLYSWPKKIAFSSSFGETPSLTYGFVKVTYRKQEAELTSLTKSGFSVKGFSNGAEIRWMACGN